MKRCLIGVSGGADSLFAAIVLKEAGWDVLACHLYLSEDKPPKYLKERLADYGIDVIFLDYTEEFKKRVVEYFIDEYAKGYTPNPCVICNRDVKLTAIAKEADKLGIEWIATGHYADKADDHLIKKHPTRKDQSYFLACVEKSIIERTLFPLAGYSREDVEKRVGSHLPKSSDLCFINRNYRSLIEERLGPRPGEIVKNDRVVGYHTGFYNYTIGQRKGIKVGNTPHYVTSIDPETNRVYVDEAAALFKDEFYLADLKLHVSEHEIESSPLECMVRFSAHPKPCRIDIKRKRVTLLQKERAITPGQIAVFYRNGCVVGCGKIGYGNN